ncbi:MAG: hypothetical protein H6835_05110 [Planctomycetes bacterium]|nr:hypothetical protein [Planctomycetota bacterium]
MTHSLFSRSLAVTAAAALFAVVTSAQEPAQSPAGGSNSGFLTGLRGFEHFHEPLGQPIYFETPFNDTGVRAIYLRHTFGNGSLLAGGHVTVAALQVRAALSERWQFIATKDGYSDISTGALGGDYGWNDLAAGLKYVMHADRENDYVVSGGLRYMAANGDRLKGVINGNVQEWSPFVSTAKGYMPDANGNSRLHTLTNLTLRFPSDSSKGNVVGHWDLHVDYDLNPNSDVVVAPVVEVHGLHYLDDATGANSGLTIGGGDYTNLGSNPKHHFVCWATLGARVELNHNLEAGVCYEFALTNRNDDIWDTRFMVDFLWRF